MINAFFVYYSPVGTKYGRTEIPTDFLPHRGKIFIMCDSMSHPYGVNIKYMTCFLPYFVPTGRIQKQYLFYCQFFTTNFRMWPPLSERKSTQ